MNRRKGIGTILQRRGLARAFLGPRFGRLAAERCLTAVLGLPTGDAVFRVLAEPARVVAALRAGAEAGARCTRVKRISSPTG